MAPFAVQATVPGPPADVAVIVVRVAGDRVSGAITDTGPTASAFDGVAGTRLGLFASPDEPVRKPWATCVSDAAGDCAFRVPGTAPGGTNRDARFTVEQLSAPAGWSANPSLRTWTRTGRAARTAYRFRTGPRLRAGSTYSSTSDFMFTSANAAHLDDAKASSGVWQQSRSNPRVANRCGLDVALVLDTSTSVGPALPRIVAAADRLTDALTGTRSRIALFSFAEQSPGASAGPNHPALTSVATAAGAASVKHLYADWATSTGTSWDRGLFAPVEAGEHYDVAVVITDGDPTSYGEPEPVQRSVHATRFKELEYGIASANALKAAGTRVIGLGVRPGLDLAPISGPTAYDGTNAARADTFALRDHDAVGVALHHLATTSCAVHAATRKPLATTAAIAEVHDGDHDGVLDAGDAIDYRFGVTNVSGARLRNVLVDSPSLGAVICPVTELAPAASTTCVSHAPYVVSRADEVAGSIRVGGRAEARTRSGRPRSSRPAVLTTTIGDRIVPRTRRRP